MGYKRILPITLREKFVLFLATGVFAYSTFQYGAVAIGRANMTYDAIHTYYPMAEAISQGVRPYVGFEDVKPPLFIYLIALGSATNFLAVFSVFGVVANTALVIGTYQWCVDNDLADIGIIASLLVAGSVIGITQGINNKIFGIAVLLITLQFKRPVWVGTGVALSGLFAQPLILAVPAIAYWKIGADMNRLARFVLSAIIVVILVFVSLAVVWDIPTVFAAAKQSLLFAASGSTGVTPWTKPIGWALKFEETLPKMAVLLFGAACGWYIAFRRRESDSIEFMAVLGLSVAIAPFVRPYWHYALLVVPAFAVMTGYGVLYCGSEGSIVSD